MDGLNLGVSLSMKYWIMWTDIIQCYASQIDKLLSTCSTKYILPHLWYKVMNRSEKTLLAGPLHNYNIKQWFKFSQKKIYTNSQAPYSQHVSWFYNSEGVPLCNLGVYQNLSKDGGCNQWQKRQIVPKDGTKYLNPIQPAHETTNSATGEQAGNDVLYIKQESCVKSQSMTQPLYAVAPNLKNQKVHLYPVQCSRYSDIYHVHTFVHFASKCYLNKAL